MLQQLADLQPVILIVLLITMYSLETFWPYLSGGKHSKQHDLHNTAIVIISFIVNGAVGLGVVYVLTMTEKNQWGLFNHVHVPIYISMPLSVLLLDFVSYLFHTLTHKVPLLWRFHRIHHSDPGLNATSALRFHPVEVVITQGLVPCFTVIVFGVSMGAFMIYGTIGIVFIIIQHSNIRLPGTVEKYGQLVFSTPGWHKIHHSDEQRHTDSHYGDIFTFWDRIFGTWSAVKPDEINYGLKDFAHPERQKFWFLLRAPFIDLNQRIPSKDDK